MTSTNETKNSMKLLMAVLAVTMIFSAAAGGLMGYWAGSLSGIVKTQAMVKQNQGDPAGKIIKVSEESAVISAVDKVSPAVVSIIISKNLPKIQSYYNSPFGSDFFSQFFGPDFQDFFTEDQPSDNKAGQGDTIKREIGGGSGFIVSPEGMIVTNKHVIVDSAAEYTVLMNDGKKYPAKVIAQDPTTDLAVLKIEAANLPTAELGDSSGLKVGQTVIAIGNALGEFRNTVSTGVVSGLARSVTAGGAGFGSEDLLNVIQTDASINEGNSGGPLLNLAGQVIGINTAMARGAENIGFAIPINEVKNTIENVKQNGRLIRPWLGVRYLIINQEIAAANKLSFDYGALILRGQNRTDLAVIPGSPADKAGLAENDILLELNGQKITEDNPLASLIAKFKPGDEITLKIMRQGKESTVKVKLEEAK